MQCNVYEVAVQRIAHLQAELQRLKAFVSTYQELVDSADEDEPLVAAEDQEQRRQLRRARPKPTPQPELERVVEQVLTTNGAPLQRAELFTRVKALGLVVGGRKEITNFGSKLSRASRLINLPKLGYWPRDVAFEPAGYRPDPAGESFHREQSVA